MFIHLPLNNLVKKTFRWLGVGYCYKNPTQTDVYLKKIRKRKITQEIKKNRQTAKIHNQKISQGNYKKKQS
jgi:hypothetical protein